MSNSHVKKSDFLSYLRVSRGYSLQGGLKQAWPRARLDNVQVTRR